MTIGRDTFGLTKTEFNDKVGKHYLVLTEHKIECKERKECYDKLEAFCFLFENDEFNLEWSLKDFILSEGNEVSEEYSISFWTKYFELDDYDKDGLIDPIMVYGTVGMNGNMDGRIKILIYQNGQKCGVRHQNGVLDHDRNTKVDADYYDLPIVIQDRVKEIMENITENNHGIFSYGWEKAMENKELKFDEN
jgi:hypothetical protein